MLSFLSIPRFAMLMAAIAIPLALAGCGEEATQSVSDGTGPNPKLPKPNQTWLPTVKIAPAEGWPEGGRPQAPEGLQVAAFARDLDHPRWLYVLPNGDVLVAESNRPEGSGGKTGIAGWVMGLVMKRAGAGVKSADRISLLRDADGDGVAEAKTVFLSGLHSPFGMALVGGDLYVANADAIVRVPYTEGATEIKATPTKLADLPGLPFNHHWTKNILPSADGSKLYATVGSNSNVAENGMEAEEQRAAILEVDRASGATRIFASGLRNPNGLALNPASGELWTVVNERDEIGSDLVPDYLTSVKDGAFYGWPYSYFGQHVDERVQPPRPDLVEKAVVPDYALGPHTAALGLAFYDKTKHGNAMGDKYAGGAFIGLHGSWNRNPPSGYKVIFVPFDGAKPSAQPQDILTGFLSPEGKAWGRPVGVTPDKTGALLVADDVGNVIWRVTATAPDTASATDPDAVKRN